MIEDPRPNPDDLLARVEHESGKRARGRLKVFFGASAGVGKTYAMLQAARVEKASGVDVVVGYVETHRRKETEALVEGLAVLPRKQIPYKGSLLPEFDIDAALARRPELLLVDELAHSNAPGSRHTKRWQDVLELVDSGINVYTTLNVQHLDSLNDVVAQVTGIVVRETLPDSVLDQADEIELVDLPANELLKRLDEGKVYVAEQAQRAAQNFFRPGNLIALRELALRRTADRVDAQMRDYRRLNSIKATWPVSERLMVCIGPSPFSARLIRATSRLASRLGAEWIVAFVETPSYAQQPAEVRSRVLASLRLAEQLGAETVTLTGERVSAAVLRYARSKNVSKIVVGKPGAPLWRRLFRESLIDELIDHSEDIEIYAITGEATVPEPAIRVTAALKPPGWKGHVLAATIVGICTLIAFFLRTLFTPTNLVMLYLLGVVIVAMRSDKKVALFASVLSVAAFDFFCIPPYYTFAVSDYEYLITFAVMFFVAVIISNLTIRTRQQANLAVDREARTQALYRLTRELAGESGIFETARVATHLTAEVFACPVVIFLPDEGRISFDRRTTDALPMPAAEEGIAQWVFDHGQPAGKDTATLSGATSLYLPLRGSSRVLGVLAIVPRPQDDVTSSPEKLHLAEVFAAQTAAALERTRSAASARDAEVRMRTEEMRSTLLSAVSHDLRTPLASITGAATSLLHQGDRFPPGTRHELLQSIAEEADRLSRLVTNLLEMTRLDSGAVVIRRDWHSLEEIVGATLHRLSGSLAGHPVTTHLPPDLPLIWVDDVLIGQVFTNLLENAIKYTPPGAAIEIRALTAGQRVQVTVRDDGPGFQDRDVDRVFEKFYRGQTQGTRGVGLGLAISQAIVAAHGGTIRATNSSPHGAAITFDLPAPESPIAQPEESLA